MHILPIPDSDEQIDHLVIGPARVPAVDSEDWDKRMPVRTSSHLKLWHGPNPKTDRLDHAHWEADQAAEKLLSAAMGRPVTVRAAMAVYGPGSWESASRLATRLALSLRFLETPDSSARPPSSIISVPRAPIRPLPRWSPVAMERSWGSRKRPVSLWALFPAALPSQCHGAT